MEMKLIRDLVSKYPSIKQEYREFFENELQLYNENNLYLFIRLNKDVDLFGRKVDEIFLSFSFGNNNFLSDHLLLMNDKSFSNFEEYIKWFSQTR